MAFVLTAWSIAASFVLSTFVWEQIGMRELVFPVVLVVVFFAVFWPVFFQVLFVLFLCYGFLLINQQ